MSLTGMMRQDPGPDAWLLQRRAHGNRSDTTARRYACGYHLALAEGQLFREGPARAAPPQTMKG